MDNFIKPVSLTALLVLGLNSASFAFIPPTATECTSGKGYYYQWTPTLNSNFTFFYNTKEDCDTSLKDLKTWALGAADHTR